ncbi:MAG: hypothetical protein ACRD0K_08755 [Egibacteraceae bacterium]
MSTRLEHASGDEVAVAVEFSSDDPTEQLRALQTASHQLDRWRRTLVAAARQRGASWAAIGEALGMSRQAAWEYYNADLRRQLEQARQRSGLTEDEAQALAYEERAAVRRRRRA